MNKKIILMNAFTMNAIGHMAHGIWRHDRDRSLNYCQASYWEELATTLEEGMFDSVFIADVVGAYDVYNGNADTSIRNAMQIPTNDPYLVVPIMARVTKNLGFGVTGNLSIEPPFQFARRMSSLDHLTDGRVGWNIVTGYIDNAERRGDTPALRKHDTRYDIAEEFVSLMYALWEGSWEEGAVIRDRSTGVFADPVKVHRINHNGNYFSVNGIHLCEPSPQRTPVLFQAGTSPKGQQFAARHAECAFIGHADLVRSKQVCENLRELAAANGRTPQDLKLFGSLTVVVASTDKEAREKADEIKQFGSLESALAQLSGWIGVDFAKYDLDEPIERMETNRIQGAVEAFFSGPSDKMTLRQVAERMILSGGAPVLVGSPITVADQLERLVDTTGIDGINLSSVLSPETFRDFVNFVVPELQTRGRYKTEYQDGTLREKLYRKGPHLEKPHPSALARH